LDLLHGEVVWVPGLTSGGSDERSDSPRYRAGSW